MVRPFLTFPVLAFPVFTFLVFTSLASWRHLPWVSRLGIQASYAEENTVNLSQPTAQNTAQGPVPDPELEKRLVTSSIYRSKPGDTLKRVAYFLYGHETWWSKIQEDNEPLRGYSADQKIPQNTEIRYRAPEVGSSYVVQPNDWLVRIVQWKYGASEYWEEIYKKNAKRISNPNLIRPGDELTLDLDGTIRSADSGQVLVEGVQPNQQAQVETAQPVPEQQPVAPPAQPQQQEVQVNAEPVREIASTPPPDDWTTNPFMIGFVVGAVLLLLLSCYWWISKRQVLALGLPFQFLKMESKKKRPTNSERKKGAAKKKPNGPDYPNTFRRYPAQDPQIDKDLIHRDQGDLEPPSGYERISAELQKKYRAKR